MKRDAWNHRYSATDLVWGTEPNRFVAEALGACRPDGRALDLACGEGRNAIWLAKQGWAVTGIDYSDVAIERARMLADAETVAIEWRCADTTSIDLESGAFSLVVVSYLQVPRKDMQAVLTRIADALAPGGRLFMIGHALRNLEEGTGGPQHPSVLWNPEELALDLAGIGLQVERCEEVLRSVETEGGMLDAIDTLVDALRPGLAGTRNRGRQ
ncbi:MAG: class I SAM-dependent methyltransferase [bacterium]|nr:class I SAM-dependent methyltransferase [bacterium]MCP5068692.1 class I SAM-dependent methyltransferase [bacterium]